MLAANRDSCIVLTEAGLAEDEVLVRMREDYDKPEYEWMLVHMAGAQSPVIRDPTSDSDDPIGVSPTQHVMLPTTASSSAQPTAVPAVVAHCQ